MIDPRDLEDAIVVCLRLALRRARPWPGGVVLCLDVTFVARAANCRIYGRPA